MIERNSIYESNKKMKTHSPNLQMNHPAISNRQ